MAVKTRPGSECMRQLPFEDLPVEIAQNFKFLAQWIAELDCILRGLKPLDCDGLKKLFDECPVCDWICECPPCEEEPPKRLLVKFDGVPFENIYAGDSESGTIWIGNIDPIFAHPHSIDYYKIFDPKTGKKVGQLEEADDTKFDSRSGYGAAYHPTRDEVWISGFRQPFPNALVVRVHHARAPFNLKAEYVYADHHSGQGNAPIEFSPKTGDLYAGYTSKTSSPYGGVVRLRASDGAIVGDAQTPSSSALGTGGSEPYYLVWHEGQGKFLVGLLRDQQWELDPETMSAGAASGPVSGLQDTGDFVPETAYDAENQAVFLIPDKNDDLYRWPFAPGGTPTDFPAAPQAPVWLAWAGTDEDPEGHFVSYLPPLKAMVASRGDDSIVFSDPDKQGRVVVYQTADKAILRDFRTGFNPARSAWAEAYNSIAVVSYWNQDSQWFVEFLPLAEDADLTIRNPRDEDGEEVPDGGPYTPPDEDVEDPPGPEDPPDDQTGGTIAPCTPAPQLVSGFMWCEATVDGDDPTTALVETGWQIQIQPSFCRGEGQPLTLNVHEIAGWNQGKNPASDAPDERFTIDSSKWEGGFAVAPNTWRVPLFSRSGTIGQADEPKCGGRTADPVRITRTYYVRRNQPDETGPGALSSQSVTLTITDPAT